MTNEMSQEEFLGSAASGPSSVHGLAPESQGEPCPGP